MAIIYQNQVPDYGASTGDFPTGKIIDKTASVAGTKLLSFLLDDIIQLFEKLINDASIVKNDTADNVSNGYQLLDALIFKIKSFVYLGSLIDLNSASGTGFYTAISPANSPGPAGEYYVINIERSTVLKVQIAVLAGGAIYHRFLSVTWSPWIQVANLSDVNTVQSNLNTTNSDVQAIEDDRDANGTVFNITPYTVNNTYTQVSNVNMKYKDVGTIRYCTGKFTVTANSSGTPFVDFEILTSISDVFTNLIYGAGGFSYIPGFAFNIRVGASSDYVVRARLASPTVVFISKGDGTQWADGDTVDIQFQGSYIVS